MAFFTKMGMSVPEIKTENLEELKQSLEQYEESEELELVRAAGTTKTDQNDSKKEEEVNEKEEDLEEIKILVPDVVVVEEDENKISDDKRFEYVVDRNFGVEV